MRVVQLGPYPPPHGGVQTNLVAIREYLRRSGHACDAINLTRHRRADRHLREQRLRFGARERRDRHHACNRRDFSTATLGAFVK